MVLYIPCQWIKNIYKIGLLSRKDLDADMYDLLDKQEIKDDIQFISNEGLSKKNNTDFPYHYTYFKLGKWILSAVLADNIFLSVSLSKNLLHSNIPKKYILYKKKWRHPGQNTLLLAIVNSGILRNRNYNNLFFAGAGMYMIGHTYAYSSGREIGKIACSS